MSEIELVPVTSLHVKCSLRLRDLGRPGFAASDCCGYPADCAVGMPDGSLMWRCPQHWNVRWVEGDPRDAAAGQDESRFGTSYAEVPRPHH